MNREAPGIGIDEIYSAALEHDDATARAAYLDEACGTDADLRLRVERLLDARCERGSFLERPLPGLTIVHVAPTLSEGPGHDDRPLQAAGAGRRRRHGGRLHVRADAPGPPPRGP